MPFCMNCGRPVEEGTLCEACKAKAQAAQPAVPTEPTMGQAQPVQPESSGAPTGQQPAGQQAPTAYPGAPAQPVYPGQAPAYQPAPAAPVYGAPMGGPASQAPKKPNKKKLLIGIIAGIAALLVLLVVLGKTVFARDFAMLFMGREKYAQTMSEQVADALADGVVDALERYTAALPTGEEEAADMELSTKITLEDSFFEAAGVGAAEQKLIEQMLGYINTLQITMGTDYDGGNSAIDLTISDADGALLGMELITGADGEQYIKLPGVDERYLKSQIKTAEAAQAALRLTFDSDKLRASLKSVFGAFVGEMKDRGTLTTLDGQELTANGETVSGKRISIELDNEELAACFKAALQAANEDGYLKEFFLTNGKAQGLSEGDYTAMLEELEGKLGAEALPKYCIISSLVSGSGKQVGHSYIFNAGSGEAELALVNAAKGVTQVALSQDGNELMGLHLEVANSEKGEIAFTLRDQGGEAVTLRLAYEGCQKVTVAGKERQVGTYAFSISDPEGMLAKSAYGSQAAILEALGDMTLTTETKQNGDSLDTRFQLSLPGLMEMEFSGAVTPKDKGTVTLPGAEDCLDMADMNGSAGQEYSLALIQYLSGTMGSHEDLSALLGQFGLSKEMLDSMLAYYISGIQAGGSAGLY